MACRGVEVSTGPGNGPFGFGWKLSLAAITPKTDKGLPQYFDAQDSDVFILSGAEDLVQFTRPAASLKIGLTRESSPHHKPSAKAFEDSAHRAIPRHRSRFLLWTGQR